MQDVGAKAGSIFAKPSLQILGGEEEWRRKLLKKGWSEASKQIDFRRAVKYTHDLANLLQPGDKLVVKTRYERAVCANRNKPPTSELTKWKNWARKTTGPREKSISFQVIANLILTGAEKYRFKLASSPLCSICNAIDDVTHHFLGCNHVDKNWQVIRKIFKMWDTFGGGDISNERLLCSNFRLFPQCRNDFMTFLMETWIDDKTFGDMAQSNLKNEIRSRCSKPTPGINLGWILNMFS